MSDLEVTLESELTLKPGRSVIQMNSNPDGSVLVVLDSQHMVTAFNLDQGSSTTLPSYSSPVTAIGVHPVTRDIVVVYADMMIKEYDLAMQKYTPFCRSFLSTCSSDLTKRNSIIRSVSFDPLHPNLILFSDDSSIIVLDKDKEITNKGLDKPAKIMRSDPSLDNSNSNSSSSVVKVGSTGVFTFLKRANQVIHFSRVRNESLVSVELNPLQLLDKLPPALKVKKYGGV